MFSRILKYRLKRWCVTDYAFSESEDRQGFPEVRKKKYFHEVSKAY